MKTKTYLKNLRHGFLHMNLICVYWKFGGPKCLTNWDILDQKM